MSSILIYYCDSHRSADRKRRVGSIMIFYVGLRCPVWLLTTTSHYECGRDRRKFPHAQKTYWEDCGVKGAAQFLNIRMLNWSCYCRHLWDADLIKCRVVSRIDENTEVFQYVTQAPPPLANRDVCILRYSFLQKCWYCSCDILPQGVAPVSRELLCCCINISKPPGCDFNGINQGHNVSHAVSNWTNRTQC